MVKWTKTVKVFPFPLYIVFVGFLTNYLCRNRCPTFVHLIMLRARLRASMNVSWFDYDPG